MNNKIKSISHRSFGFRTAENFIAAIYHCCARLPLPVERYLHFSGRNQISRLNGSRNFRIALDATLFDQSRDGGEYKGKQGERCDEGKAAPRRYTHVL